MLHFARFPFSIWPGAMWDKFSAETLRVWLSPVPFDEQAAAIWMAA